MTKYGLLTGPPNGQIARILVKLHLGNGRTAHEQNQVVTSGRTALGLEKGIPTKNIYNTVMIFVKVVGAGAFFGIQKYVLQEKLTRPIE